MGKSTLENRTLINFFFCLAFVLLSLVYGCESEKGSSEETPPADTLLTESTSKWQLHWNWEDSTFTETEQTKLKKWIQKVYDATMVTLGTYPFDVHVYFHPSTSDYSPVPFGYATRKGGKSQVHFYVNKTAGLEELLEDWTAPHEFSHLSIPFLGKPNKWFTEGFATFLSRQTMMEMGYYTQEEFDELYFSKIQENRQYYASTTSTFIEVSDSLLSQGKYGPMYWGGTAFFLTIDLRLRLERNMRFIEVIQKYQECCRTKDKNLKQVIRSFDDIIGAEWCRELLDIYREKPALEALKQLDHERN